MGRPELGTASAECEKKIEMKHSKANERDTQKLGEKMEYHSTAPATRHAPFGPPTLLLIVASFAEGLTNSVWSCGREQSADERGIREWAFEHFEARSQEKKAGNGAE
jgi:hypothetical protein